MTAGASPSDRIPPQVLRDYALLADGERGAVVGPHGDIVWLCAPRWDSDAVFTSLIGGAGEYTVTPAGRNVWGGSYEDGSMIWRSRWVTDNGIIECREALAFPGDPHRVVLLRRIHAVDHAATVTVSLEPRAGYGQHELSDLHCHAGVWTGRSGGLHLRWTGGPGRPPATATGKHCTLEVDLEAGQHHDLVLELSDQPLPEQPGRRRHRLDAPPKPPGTPPSPPWTTCSPPATPAAATPCCGGSPAAAAAWSPPPPPACPSGPKPAATTTTATSGSATSATPGKPSPPPDPTRCSTPPSPSSVTGCSSTATSLAPAYTTTGEPVPDQRHLDLAGYPGGYDIIGNWVNQQFQLDAFGEALLLFAAAARHDRLDTEGWRAAEAAAGAIAPTLDRTRRRHLGNRQPALDPQPPDRRGRTARHRRRAPGRGPSRGLAHAWPTTSSPTPRRTPCTPTDTGNAHPRTPPWTPRCCCPDLRGAVPADDPRTTATLHAYLRDLTRDGYAYRFRHDDRPLPDAEGSFLLCGFLVALSLHQQHQPVEARAWYERTRAACGPPQLFSEEYDASPAPDARQPPPSLRPRPDDRNLRPTRPLKDDQHATHPDPASSSIPTGSSTTTAATSPPTTKPAPNYSTTPCTTPAPTPSSSGTTSTPCAATSSTASPRTPTPPARTPPRPPPPPDPTTTPAGITGSPPTPPSPPSCADPTATPATASAKPAAKQPCDAPHPSYASTPTAPTKARPHTKSTHATSPQRSLPHLGLVGRDPRARPRPWSSYFWPCEDSGHVGDVCPNSCEGTAPPPTGFGNAHGTPLNP